MSWIICTPFLEVIPKKPTIFKSKDRNTILFDFAFREQQQQSNEIRSLTLDQKQSKHWLIMPVLILFSPFGEWVSDERARGAWQWILSSLYFAQRIIGTYYKLCTTHTHIHIWVHDVEFCVCHRNTLKVNRMISSRGARVR